MLECWDAGMLELEMWREIQVLFRQWQVDCGQVVEREIENDEPQSHEGHKENTKAAFLKPLPGF